MYGVNIQTKPGHKKFLYLYPYNKYVLAGFIPLWKYGFKSPWIILDKTESGVQAQQRDKFL